MLPVLCLCNDPDAYPKDSHLLTSVRASHIVGYVSWLSEGMVLQDNKEEFLIGPFDKLQSHFKIRVVGGFFSIA